MICPYNENRHVMINKYEHDNDGAVVRQEVWEVWGQAPCLKEKCGAYFDGRCRYNE